MGREEGSLVELMTGFEDRFKGGGGGREGMCSGGYRGEETRLGGTSGTKSWTGDADVVALLEGGGGGGLRASKTERSGSAWFNNLIGTFATRGGGGTRRRGGGGWVEGVMVTS